MPVRRKCSDVERWEGESEASQSHPGSHGVGARRRHSGCRASTPDLDCGSGLCQSSAAKRALWTDNERHHHEPAASERTCSRSTNRAESESDLRRRSELVTAAPAKVLPRGAPRPGCSLWRRASTTGESRGLEYVPGAAIAYSIDTIDPKTCSGMRASSTRASTGSPTIWQGRCCRHTS
jgi:hypothetical protein